MLPKEHIGAATLEDYPLQKLGPEALEAVDSRRVSRPFAACSTAMPSARASAASWRGRASIEAETSMDTHWPGYPSN
jgi:hypothetical protein